MLVLMLPPASWELLAVDTAVEVSNTDCGRTTGFTRVNQAWHGLEGPTNPSYWTRKLWKILLPEHSAISV